jgi:hypothetical protein
VVKFGKLSVWDVPVKARQISVGFLQEVGRSKQLEYQERERVKVKKC